MRTASQMSQKSNLLKAPTCAIKRLKLSLSLSLTASVFLPLIILSQPATAETFSVCVICNEPGKVYQCGITYQSLDGVYRQPNEKGLQFACIQEVAKYGNHSKCAASRKTAAECGGEPYTLKNQAILYSPPKNLEKEAEKITNAPPPATPDKSKEQPTLVETTEKTYDKAKDTVSKSYEKTTDTVKTGYDKTSSTVKKTVKTVGDSIGSAAKTTYNCLTSFFQKCKD
ncbi:MAG: hypothetical protein DHS20C08_10030 [Rhodomicrobium sp.]|nr:MAG: hypothetical protein DHS20C08_10030 [Rhodomicrobium sp.]